ncbi:SDR family NAD(P)-dependent oxidoreductase [Leeuwenhoekiella marinoflava]|uniref:NAD(P)-dependent dehydrogenase (Short-subunit alcohol dehydrogenase family) n=2 Tax=Leeuwenhoekiella marinoflava TaxID=988 RepID=A0A4Q0PN18_9FLAO|nr:SDR family NAD(P)-dependent oxidoreductase [Leeuwenhoekiella marinoflava]RXG31833.1 NAD(P)-dependent dehydrogenase (short-subunit alcohol dehydrogenase family) [Leeuwenhoekiella marinoflava]SHF03400.1 NAD(P)-dependent dehydrogenase, short-chain alcohol dehydrogenase family [Leeuwenhoekiella marinoflava DSM 3653]
MDSNKKVFITGANKGIGFATTKLFAEKGYQVWMGVRNMERGAKAHQLLKEQNLDVHLVQIDISNDESVAEAANYLGQHIKQLDILINNAGLAQDLSVSPSEESLSAIKKQYEVNTFGPVRVTQALLPLLKKAPKASIIMLSSIVGSLTLSSDESIIYGQVNFAGYSSSKTALNALIVAFAKELKPYGIPVIAIEPGHIKTDLNGNTGTETPASAAKLIAKYALSGDISNTGKFFGPNGILPW